MIDIKAVADRADMIINGYAFTNEGDLIRVLNLNDTTHSAVLGTNGRMIETSMDDMELGIVCRYLNENKQFMED